MSGTQNLIDTLKDLIAEGTEDEIENFILNLDDEELLEVDNYRKTSVYNLPETISNEKQYSLVSITQMNRRRMEHEMLYAMTGYVFRAWEEYEPEYSDEILDSLKEKYCAQLGYTSNYDLVVDVENENEIPDLENEVVESKVEENEVEENNNEESKVEESKESETTESKVEENNNEENNLENNIGVVEEPEIVEEPEVIERQEYVDPNSLLDSLPKHPDTIRKERENEVQQLVDEELERMKENDRSAIKAYLDTHFNYNPDLHVKSLSHENDGYDSERPIVNKDKNKYKGHRVPPVDTLHRFRFYWDVNYDIYKTMTDDLTPFKRDLVDAIMIYKTFTGVCETEDDEKKLLEECVQWRNDHVDDFNVSDVLTVENGRWAYSMGNRDKISFYNKNTVMLEEIFKYVEQNQKLGEDLMRNKIRKQKKKEIKKFGPEPAALRKYKADYNQLKSLGVKEALTEEDRVKLVKLESILNKHHLPDIPKEYHHVYDRIYNLLNAENLPQDSKETLLDINDYLVQHKKLSDDHKSKLNKLEEQIEMLNAPDDSIVVPIWENTGKDMKRYKFYTKSESMEETAKRLKELERYEKTKKIKKLKNKK